MYGLGLAAGSAALVLHFLFAMPDVPAGEEVRLPPWEQWLLVLEGGSVFLGVGFYVSRRFARWVGDHYSELVIKENQGIFLRWMNCLCGACLLLTRGLLSVVQRRVYLDDG